MSQIRHRDCQNDKKEKQTTASIILSKFNTVYRHSVLDILTYYAEIPTDPNPDNNPLSTRDPNDSRNNNPNVTTTILNSKAESNTITNVKFKEIAFDQVIISFKHPLVDMEMLKPIPFDEKCKNWTEVESKLMEMSKISANARNLSHLRVSGIYYPTSIFNLFLVSSILVLIYGFFDLDSLYDTFFLKYIPSMCVLKPFHNYILYATMVIHTIEVYFLLYPRIIKYRVPFDYTIEWCVLTMIDGFESIKRFDKYVETLSPDDVYYDFTATEYFL